MSRGHLSVAVLLVAALSLAGCSEDEPYADYCTAVEEHQTTLGEAIGGGGPDALISVLPVLEDLRDQAPADVADDWQQVVGRIAALAEALDAAGVDAATYDRDDPPASLTDAQATAIDAAARELNSAPTREALIVVETQVRDVCGTPLYRSGALPRPESSD